MRYFILVLPAILLLGVLNLHAQQIPKGLENSATDSLKVIDDSCQSALAQMPIYNPKDLDSKMLIYKPEGISHNMPVIGQKDSLLNKGFPLNSGKNLFKQWPSDIDEKKKDNSAEQK